MPDKPLFDMSKATPIAPAGGAPLFDMSKATPIAPTSPAPIRPAGLPPGVVLQGFPAPPKPNFGRAGAVVEHPFTGGFDYDTRDVKSNGSETGGSKTRALVQNLLAPVARTVLSPIRHPVDTAKGIAAIPVNMADHSGTLADTLGLPTPKQMSPVRSTVADFQDNGAAAAIPHLVGTAAGMYLGGEALKPVGNLAKVSREIPRRILAGDVNKPIVGSSVTPSDRYIQAKRLGVNLDAADATNNPFLGNIKRLGENSLAGGHVYDSLKASNTSALSGSMDNFLNSLFDGDREAGGAAIQDTLKQDHARLHDSASSGFNKLTEATGGSAVPGAADVGMTAKRIVAQQKPYFDRFPSLTPSRTMSVLDDVAGLAPADPKVGRITPPAPADWSTMHRLGSDLHNLSADNPDLIKTRAQSWIQQLEGENGAAIRDAGAGLTPELRPIFDKSHADWADMKSTYDNPQSQFFYNAVRTGTPSTLFDGAGLGKTPEGARNIVSRLSPGGVPSPALGALRRGTVESALKTTNDGSPNFKTFGTQLNRIAPEYRAELFSPGQNETLRDFNNTSNVIGKDFNPSGSAKQGQKIAEALAMIPSGGLPALQYPIAKIMNSPRAVDWLMSKPSPRPISAPNLGSLFLAPKKTADR